LSSVSFHAVAETFLANSGGALDIVAASYTIGLTDGSALAIVAGVFHTKGFVLAVRI
jgi:hypothetical protein